MGQLQKLNKKPNQTSEHNYEALRRPIRLEGNPQRPGRPIGAEAIRDR